MFFSLLDKIKKNLIISILIAMFLGLIVGYYYDISWFKSLIIPLTFMLVYPMMVSLNFKTLLDKSNVKLQLATQLINFILIPLGSFLIGYLFFRDNSSFRLGLLLIALLPTSGMTISWTVMAKGNVNEAIRMVIFGLLLGALLSPFYISFFLGSEVNVPVFDILKQILIVVFLPMLVAFITRYSLIKIYSEDTFNKSIKKRFPPFATLGVVLMIFVAISLRARVLINNPSLLLQIILPLIIFYGFVTLVAVGSAKLFFNKEDGIALTNGTIVRNLSLSLAITLGAFPSAGIAALLIAIAYVIQVQLAAFNVKYITKML